MILGKPVSIIIVIIFSQVGNRQDSFGHGVSRAREPKHEHRPADQYRRRLVGNRLQAIRNQRHHRPGQSQGGHAGEENGDEL